MYNERTGMYDENDFCVIWTDNKGKTYSRDFDYFRDAMKFAKGLKDPEFVEVSDFDGETRWSLT